MDSQHDRHSPPGQNGLLSASVVNILLAIHTELGALKSAVQGTRQATQDSHAALRDLFNARIADLKEEVFYRFQRTEARIASLEEQQRCGGKKPSALSSVLSILKVIPWGLVFNILGILAALGMGLFGLMSPDAVKLEIKRRILGIGH